MKKLACFYLITLATAVMFIMLPVLVFGGTIQLPKTGQTKCWDTNYNGPQIPCIGTDQDGDIQAGVAWPSPRFHDNGNGTKTDSLTGLMWTKNANPPNGKMNWYEALDYVAAMNTGTYQNFGYTDWRLPNVNELVSLINAEQPNSATWLSNQGFTNVQSVEYWSSTYHTYYPSYDILVSMLSGNTWGTIKTEYGHYLWPVRAGQCGVDTSVICLPKTGQTVSYYNGDDGDLEKGVAWPDTRFHDNGNGTVTDSLTGLMWTKNANQAGISMNFQQALNYVQTVNTGGYNDWRLPNKKELQSLIDYSQYNPALPRGNPFTNVHTFYVSSTTWSYDPNYVWYVNMVVGGMGYNPKGAINDQCAWPVRAGQCESLGDSDGDTFCNDVDNCPNIYNPDQTDSDNDEVGDVCDYKYWKALYEACLNSNTTTTATPTNIQLSALDVEPSDKKVMLRWRTESETDNAGFNIWRAEGFVKVNNSVIPALGSPVSGSEYDFVDEWILNGKRYFYLLEDIDTNGISTFHGPIKAVPRWWLGVGR